MANRGLALWDFDGTLYEGDSFIDFLKYTHGKLGFYSRILVFMPSFIEWQLGLINNGQAKERLFSLFYAGWDFHQFNHLALRFQMDIVPGKLNREALQKLNWHHEQGHRQYIISATFTELLLYTADKLKISCLGTDLEIVEGKVTGKFRTPNCYGDEKVRRLKEFVEPENCRPIYAYGDSSGDSAMLQLADEAFLKKFF